MEGINPADLEGEEFSVQGGDAQSANDYMALQDLRRELSGMEDEIVGDIDTPAVVIPDSDGSNTSSGRFLESMPGVESTTPPITDVTDSI